MHLTDIKPLVSDEPLEAGRRGARLQLEMHVPGEPPLWANIILRRLDTGRPVYFASGADRIVGLRHEPRAGGQSVVTLSLEKADGSRPSQRKGRHVYTVTGQTYRIPELSYDRWTLETMKVDRATGETIKDGLRLTMVKDKPADRLEEMEVAGRPPLWFTLIQKGLAAGKKFYFAPGANKIYDVRQAGTGYRVLMTDRKTGAGRNYTMVADNAENWTLTKFEDGHLLALKKDEPVTEALGGEEPLVVTLINQRVDKGGAVQVDVPLPGGRRLKGWVVQKVTPEPSLGGSTIYRLVTANHHSGARGKVMHLTSRADEFYRLTKRVDGNGNPVLALVSRDDA